MSRPRKESARKKTPRKGTTLEQKPIDAVPTAIPDEESARFVRNLLTRGEAVPAGEELPPGATHEIVTGGENGIPKVVRKRFSAY
jgi:hypothetical protein